MENFESLYKIGEEIVEQSFKTSQINFGLFLQEMENEFARLGFRTPRRGGVERILILRLDAVGDFILTSAAIRELRANYPSAFITLVVNRRVYPLAEFCPYVNEVIPFDTPFVSPIYNRNLLDIIKTLRFILEMQV